MKAVVVILVLAVVGGGAYLLFSGGPDFGTEPAHPLGTWEKLTAYTADHELTPGGAVAAGEFGGFFAELDEGMREREDLNGAKYLDRVPGYPHYVLVVRDPAGKVVAVGGQFRSGLLEFSTGGSRSNVMLAKLWLAVTGAEPKFEKRMFGANAGQDYLHAEVKGSGYRALWKKEGPDGLGLPHQTVDKVAFVVE